jgi:hypothetical protein
LETGLASGVALLGFAALVESQAGGREHEARIDAVVASRDTSSRSGASARPSGTAAFGASTATEDFQHVVHDRAWLADVDPGWAGGRANLDAFSASAAAVKNILDPYVERGNEYVSAVGHSCSESFQERYF